MSSYNFFQADTYLGIIFFISSPNGVSGVVFGKDRFKHLIKALGAVNLTVGSYAEKAGKEVELYLEGKLKDFQTKLDLSSGTPFQISVWKELLKLPYGKVKTYREIAKNIGNPGAARAVGNAVGANPIPIIIPCHRVVATNGLGGYSCGIEIKRKLLRTEGVIQ